MKNCKMKKWLCLTLVLLVLLSVTGCGSNEEKPYNGDIDYGDDQGETDYISDVVIKEATYFRDGTALILTPSKKNDSIYSLAVLNTKGQAKTVKDVFVSPDSDDNSSKKTDWGLFDNKHAYVDYIDKVSDSENVYKRFVIVDDKGNATAISPLDADYTIKCGGDGLYLVFREQKADISSKKETQWGVVDVKGRWVCKPTEATTFMPSNMAQYFSGDGYRTNGGYYGPSYVFYLGEHCFAFCYVNEHKSSFQVAASFFNADTGLIKTIDNIEILSTFYNGKAICSGVTRISDHSDKGETLYTIDSKSFDLKPILTHMALSGLSGDRLTCALPHSKNGLFYGVAFISKYIDKDHYDEGEESKSFYDFNGNEIISLSEYGGVYDPNKHLGYNYNRFKPLTHHPSNLFEFFNGKAIIYVHGADSNRYITAIDMNGNTLFDPVRVKNCGDYDYQADIIPITVERNVDGETREVNAFLDASTGEIRTVDFDVLYGITWDDGYAFSNGCFIDSKGETLHIRLK